MLFVRGSFEEGPPLFIQAEFQQITKNFNMPSTPKGRRFPISEGVIFGQLNLLLFNLQQTY